MGKVLPQKRIEVFVESMELASLQPYFRVPRYQHEVFRITTDNLSYAISSKRFFPDKDREALSLIEGLDKDGLDIRIHDISEGFHARLKAFLKGVFRTPAVFIEGRRLKKITKEEIDSSLARR